MGLSPGSGWGRLDSCGWGEALFAPSDPLGARAMLGKLKQRPTMASFPPWAAAEQGLQGGLWGPLLFPVLAAGLLASGKWAGSRLGISSPPTGLALAGQSSRFCERGQCGGVPAPLSAAPALA